MGAFEDIKRELEPELDIEKARKFVKPEEIGGIIGDVPYPERRYETFLKRNSGLLGYSRRSMRCIDFLACALLSGQPRKHDIIKNLAGKLDKSTEELTYFMKLGEEIARCNGLNYDPLAGLVSSVRQPGSSFYNIQDGMADLEGLMSSPVSARGKNSGLLLGELPCYLQINFQNPQPIYVKGDKQPVTGLYLEPETPRLYLEAGQNYVAETDLDFQTQRHYLKNKEVLTNKVYPPNAIQTCELPSNSIDLRRLRHGSDTIDIRNYTMISDGLEIFIDNVGKAKDFPEHGFRGVEYLY